MLIHDFDMARWILGDEVVSVYATGACPGHPEIEAHDDLSVAAVTLRTRNGRVCQIHASRSAAYGYDQRFEVLGPGGMLQAGNLLPTQVVAWTASGIAGDTPEAFFLQRYEKAYAAEMAQFLDALTQGTPMPTTIEDGIAALELAEWATRSWREGCALAV